VTEQQEGSSIWYGYSPRDKEFVNLFEKGIIDPAKVTRLALENASSIAGTMLITECTVSIIKEDTPPQEDLLQYGM
jgi:chaperonin GroEL